MTANMVRGEIPDPFFFELLHETPGRESRIYLALNSEF